MRVHLDDYPLYTLPNQIYYELILTITPAINEECVMLDAINVDEEPCHSVAVLVANLLLRFPSGLSSQRVRLFLTLPN